MSTISQYRPLFTVEMLHDYYLSEDMELYNGDAALQQQTLGVQYRGYDIANDLSIRPTDDCKRILKDYRLIFKPTPLGFFVGAQVKSLGSFTAGPFTPFIMLEKPLVFRFAVHIRNKYFSNITNVRMERDVSLRDRYIYYFSNLNNNGANRLYLTKPLQSFNPAYKYESGEIILQGSQMFEAMEDNGPTPVIDMTQWKEIFIGQTPHFQFVAAADRMALRPAQFTHSVINIFQQHKALSVFLFDSENILLRTFDFKADDSSDPAAVLKTVTLDLRQMAPGRYKLEVRQPDGTPLPVFDLEFYLDEALYREGSLAVIECFHRPGASLGVYRLIDNANQDQLLHPVYTVRWKNRSTYWRYYYATPPSFSSTDVSVFGPPPVPRVLMTKTPKSLTNITRRIVITSGGTSKLLPNPGVSSIFPGNDGRIYSEINMGGGLGPP